MASPLTALLREVNETVLGRSLQFESGGGCSLSLDVVGRRVLRLTAVNGLSNAETCLAAETLEDEQKDDLIKLLQALAVPRQDLHVTSGPMSRGGEGMSVGLPVALLADLLLIELNEVKIEIEPEPEPVIEPEPEPGPEREPVAVPEAPKVAVTPAAEGGFLKAFAGTMGEGLLAWLIVGGANDGAIFGPDEMVSHLNGFLDEEGEALDRQLDLVTEVPEGPVCLVLGTALAERHSLLVARAEGGVLLGVTEGDATMPVLRAWNAVRG